MYINMDLKCGQTIISESYSEYEEEWSAGCQLLKRKNKGSSTIWLYARQN